MTRPHTRRPRRWVAGAILMAFFIAVAASAAAGWWYARESPAHQGPIVVIAVGGVPAASMPAYGSLNSGTPAIDTLAADAVVFDRAYAHSPQTLPAHASLLTGRLPIEHGVRDDAGFTLTPEHETLPELLRSRGFRTGAAVSSFLLRADSGVAQGFTFFDGTIPASPGDPAPSPARAGAQTVAAAEQWLQSQDDRRFFLFVQVDREDADAAVTRLVSLLKSRDFYDPATVVFVGDRGDPTAGLTLDDATLRVPLIVKQPARDGAGRRVAAPVQQIDLLPTILDLVRAPVPGDLKGRSLRGVLADADATVDDTLVYSESVAPWYRFGGQPSFALTSATFRYVRGENEHLVSLVPRMTGEGGESTETGRMRRELDRMLAGTPLHRPAAIAPSDEERFALLGYLSAPRLAPEAMAPLSAGDQVALAEEHRAAALLIGQKNYSAGIRALQRIVGDYPELTTVHYQLGALLARTGRMEEAIHSFRVARELEPELPDFAVALADALMRAGHTDAAGTEAEQAIALAQKADAGARGSAYEVAARVALARADAASARTYAAAAQEANPSRLVVPFVEGRLLYEAAEYDKAADAFRDAIAGSTRGGHAIADLHLYLGESLAHLDRYDEAERHYREELRAFPRNLQAYASLALLYRASNRDDAVEDILNELVAGTPTPEGYAVAARLWTILGDRTRAEALRSDARDRFRGDPQPALLGRGARR